VLGPDGQSLLIGRPASVRRWVAAQLGAGPAPKKGMRPPTNLAPITSAVAFAATTTPFAQRLAFERVMGRHVPLSKRQDLKPPVYLHLDPTARFPRLVVRPGEGDREHLYGPFRSRAAAQSAIEALHALFPLRPCDFVFEPAPDLALGLGCVFAQVRTCSAPCLQRVTEDDYRALAGRAAAVLGAGARRAPELAAAMPSWVTAMAQGRGLVMDRTGATVELYPVLAGAVIEEAMASTTLDGLDEAVAALRWPEPSPPRDDTRWLLPWLHGKRPGTYLDLAPGEPATAIAARLRA
jgi:DNA polymerase-3 subunit epsilon